MVIGVDIGGEGGSRTSMGGYKSRKLNSDTGPAEGQLGTQRDAIAGFLEKKLNVSPGFSMG